MDPFLSPSQAAELTFFARLTPQNADTAVFSDVLPDAYEQSVEYRIEKILRNRTSARFRAYDSAGELAERGGRETITGKLPPITDILPLAELEQLLMTQVRLGGGDVERVIVDQVFDDAQILVDRIRMRVAYARRQLLTSPGKVELSDDGLAGVEIDFGVDGSQSVATNTDHTAPSTATVLDDLIEVVRAHRARGGEAGQIKVNFATLSAWMQSEQLRGMVASATTPGLVTVDQIQAIFASVGLPPVVVEDSTVVDPTGTVVPAVPDNVALILPAPGSNRLGVTAWGVPAPALDVVGEGAMSVAEAPGLYVTAYQDRNPKRVFTQADALVCPVLSDDRHLTVVDVTGP